MTVSPLHFSSAQPYTAKKAEQPKIKTSTSTPTPLTFGHHVSSDEGGKQLDARIQNGVMKLAVLGVVLIGFGPLNWGATITNALSGTSSNTPSTEINAASSFDTDIFVPATAPTEAETSLSTEVDTSSNASGTN